MTSRNTEWMTYKFSGYRHSPKLTRCVGDDLRSDFSGANAPNTTREAKAKAALGFRKRTDCSAGQAAALSFLDLQSNRSYKLKAVLFSE